jgi:hypothetical protein
MSPPSAAHSRLRTPHRWRRARALAALLAVALLSASCEIDDTVSPTDEPVVGTTTVYELLRWQSDLDKAFNIVFVPDASYGDLSVLANRRTFVSDIADVVENSYWQNQGYFNGQVRFNYFYMTESGSVTESPPHPLTGEFQCPAVTWPPEATTDAAFADQLLLIHQNELRDCGGGGRASAEPTSFRTVVHETGHALFTLPDEYDDDGAGYWVAPPVLYATKKDCTSDPANAAWRNCTALGPDGDGNTWWRSQGHITTNLIMRNIGAEVWESGPADWSIMADAYQSLGSSIGPPSVFAPDRWSYTVPSP